MALYPGKKVGRDSSVGIATRYGLDGPGIESQWTGRDFSHPSRSALGPILYNGFRVFPVDRPPHLAPRLKKSRAIPLPPLVLVACYRASFTFTCTQVRNVSAPGTVKMNLSLLMP